MQLEQPRENLPAFKGRVKDIELRRGMSSTLLKYIYPSAALAAIFLIVSLFKRLSCLWSIVGLIFVCIAIISIYMWYQFRRAEEFEERLRAERLRELNGAAKCKYLDGNVPDGTGKIGKCALFNFVLDDNPYCIYCYEYEPKVKGEGGKRS